MSRIYCTRFFVLIWCDRLSYNTWRRGLFNLCVQPPSRSRFYLGLTRHTEATKTTAGLFFARGCLPGYSM
jgi:hypothetical protein